ncbi:type IV secretion protein Rhs [Pseudomonas putida]|uniref:RHS repeat-associated core domain-containing protein n=1 Tax=Pseudomonas putida TaxID=303 RepID=UPI000F7B9BDB|nr:RHS repeat-associated core domain-containing protein [Pseudomonas putida]RSC28597.1 type IV secretion protein Rhs [Pseudomonas putida]
MSDALWAAREGDALMHTSMMADIVGGVLEVAANIAIGALATAAVAAALGLTVATGGLGCFVLGAVVGLVVGVVMAKTGADTGLSRLCEGIGNALFPPSVQANILTGSSDTKTNGKRAARAAGIVTGPAQALAAGGEGAPGAEKEESFLDMAKGFFSQMWRPTVASPAANTEQAEDDKILCSKHPPMPPQYLAEGSSKVLINGHPACRSGDRSTCEAVIVDAGEISENVRIGGEPIVVREIRSGKTPGIGLAITALLMLRGRGGKFYSRFGCMLVGGVTTLITSEVTGALTSAIAGSPNPVHAPTGAKVLADDLDLDFSLQSLLPVDWQRSYNSRDERRDGLFGASWSVPYEVFVTVQADRLLYNDEQMRVIDMGQIPPGDAVFSAAEGLSVRHALNGELLIEDIETGLYRLFEPAPTNPSHLRLSKLGDRNDNRIHLDYDDQGRLSGLRDTFDRVCVQLIAHERWPQRLGRIEQVFEDGNRQTLVSYGYDHRGDLNEVRDALGQLQRRFAYDDGQRLIEHQTPAGLRCFYEWVHSEDGWRVSLHTTSEGERYQFRYDIAQGVTEVTDNLGRTSIRHWNRQYQVERYLDVLGNCWQFQWNDERQLLGATDPLGGQWQYFYDESGNLAQTIDPLGRSESTLWLEHWSLPREECDSAGNRWRYRYDQRGNCISETDPLHQVTRYQYDERGQVIVITDAAGRQRHQRWNTRGLLVEDIDCSGYRTRYEYDRHDFPCRITDADGESTTYTYDVLGRMIEQVEPDGRTHRYSYTVAGLLSAYVDPLGHQTLYHYDRHGQLTEQRDPLGRSVRLGYDLFARLVTLTNENGEHYRFEWDAADRLQRQHNLDLSSKGYRYDALGELLEIDWHPIPGSPEPVLRHTYVRDAGSRLLSFTTDDGCTEYCYDGVDQLLSVTFTDTQGQSTSVAFEYDGLGQRLAEITDAGKLLHRYDELGNLIQTQLPDGRTVNRLYYGSGHLHQVNIDGTVVCDFERDRLHREVSRTQGRMSLTREYDRCGRLRTQLRRNAQQPAHGPAPWQQRFVFDDLDNLVQRYIQQPGKQHQVLLPHDASGRVMACQSALAGQNESFHYDLAANLTETPGVAVRHNQLQRYRDNRYRYDGFARLLERRSSQYGLQTFTYDAQERLVQVATVLHGRERKVSMHYDPLGRRIGKDEHDDRGNLLGSTRFLWDGLQLLGETRNGHSTLYLYGDEYEPMARVDGLGEHQQIRYYQTDLNGQPVELNDTDGQTLWECEYRTWGATLNERNTAPFSEQQNLRFQGQYLDRETGLHYNLFRYYDPQVGRFTQPDPIGLEGGINLYQYSPNPFTWIDPHGLDWNYILTDRNGKAYYHGRASDKASLEDVMRRHGKTKGTDGYRFRYGDRINQVTPHGTPKDVARGIENAGIRERKQVLGRKNPRVRGNKIHGISDAKAKTVRGRRRIKAAKTYLRNSGVSKVSSLPVLASKAAPRKVNTRTCGK